MTIADWALIISVFSTCIALASFIWNIWSKFIYPKPKISVAIAVMNVMPNPHNLPSFVSLSATNHGPNDVTLKLALTRTKKSLFKKSRFAIMQPAEHPHALDQTSGPFSGGLPKSLKVGEEFAVYFPITKNWSTDGYYFYGFEDTFGRQHWCTKKNAKKFEENLKQKNENVK